MNKRPRSITIIGWLLIVLTSISVISTISSVSNPIYRDVLEQMEISVAYYYTTTLVGFVITLVSAIGMLKGKNWSRYLYVGSNILGLILSLFAQSISTVMLVPLLSVLVIGFFLFRPVANAYFTTASAVEANEAT